MQTETSFPHLLQAYFTERLMPNSQKTQNQLCGSIANPNLVLYSDNSQEVGLLYRNGLYPCLSSWASTVSRMYWSTSRPVIAG
jgi:hypothetical protein